MADEGVEPREIVVYTRPGCPFSMMLRQDMHAAGLTWTERDIWQDRDAAAQVRAVADGNEVVPTLNVNGQWMVNPSLEQVQAAVRPAA